MPGDRASAAFPAFALASAVRAIQPVAAAVVRVEPVAGVPVAVALADPAHVASAVVVADDLHAALVDFAPVLIRDAFVVGAAAAEQLRVVALVSVVLVLRLVRPAAVVVAQVELPVQPAAHLQHVPLVAVHSAVVAAVAPCAVVRVVYPLTHAVVEPVELVVLAVEEQLVVAPFVVHRVPLAHLAS